MSISIPEDIPVLLEDDCFNPVAALTIIVRGCLTVQHKGGAHNFFEENPVFKERILKRLVEYVDVQPVDEDIDGFFSRLFEKLLNRSEPNNSFIDHINIICDIELSKGDNYHSRMKMLNNSVIIDILEIYYGDEEFIHSNPDLPITLLRAILYQRLIGSSNVTGDLWIQRDNDVDQRYHQLMGLLMDCYQKVTETEDIIQKPHIQKIELDHHMMKRIRNRLHGSLIKSAGKH